MEKEIYLFESSTFGSIEVRNIMIDLDGCSLEEGIEIHFLDYEAPTIEVLGHRDLEDITIEEIENLIE